MSNLTNVQFKDGDGDDSSATAADINVRSVSNGWILDVVDDEQGEEYTEVFSFDDAKGLIRAIRLALGAM